MPTGTKTDIIQNSIEQLTIGPITYAEREQFKSVMIHFGIKRVEPAYPECKERHTCAVE